MWLVGSTPGATTGAAVAYDDAEDPSKIGAPWCVYDGSAWVRAAGAAVGAINVDGENIGSTPLKMEVLPGAIEICVPKSE